MRNATLFVRLVFLASLTLLPCTGGSHFARRYFQLNVIPGSTVSTAAGLPLLDQRSDKAYDYKVDLEHLLRGDSNAADFAILLKNIASLRETVKLTQHHKQVLAQGLVSHLPEMTVSTFSSGIWALGTLGCSLTDLFPPYSSLVRNSTDQAAPLSTIPLNYDQFVEYISAFAASADSIEFMRLIVGLSKLGVTFQALPEAQRNQVYVLLENPELSARDLSTIIYSLGIMKGQIAPNAKQAAIPSDVVSRLLGHVESKLEQMSAQGFVNTLYGLSRIGVDWNAVSPCYGFIEAQVKTMSETPSYSAKEICSFVLSLAMMQVPMSSLPQSFREHLFSALDRIIPTLLPKEVANIIWALGKLRYQWRVQGRVGGIGEAATEAAHMLAVQSALTAQLVRTLPHSTVFDTESIITGLSFAQVHMEMLPPDTQQALQKLVSSHVNKMNIFCLCNVLCGLAKMKVKVPSAAGAQSFLNESLSAALLARTSHVFHTLLPEQFGPVMWALGMMGYTKTTIPVNTQQRMIAILSRVFQKLNSRAAAYSLWGLAKLSFVWSDLTVPYKSVADGIPAPVFTESVEVYLKRRVSMFRGHEYALLLFSLGKLEARLPNFSPAVRDKIHHRASRVSTFLSSHAVANSLTGLGLCGETWENIGEPAREAWCLALFPGTADEAGVTSPGLDAKDVDDMEYSEILGSSPAARGLEGMSMEEVGQVVAALQLLGAANESLPPAIASAIDAAVARFSI